MTALFSNMGFIRWPMLIAAAFLLLQIARAVIAARSPTGAARTRHAVLVWGFLNALLGVLGTVLGLAVTAGSVAAAGRIEPTLLGGGLQIALSPSILGLLLLTVAIIAWLALQAVQPLDADGADPSRG